MKKYLVAILLSLSFNVIDAQGISLESQKREAFNFKNSLGSISLDPLAIYGIDGNKKRFNYADVGGSPFLFDDWRLANIYDNHFKKIASVRVRFNTYSDQIHFLDSKEQELIADKDPIKKIEVLKKTGNDEVEFVLEKGFSAGNNLLTTDQFVEVLNAGSVQLLKQITNKVIEKDSLVGTTKVIKFSSSANYFLNTKTSCERLKRLDQAEIFALLSNKDILTEFKKNNKQKLRKEKDVIEFLNYYNSYNH